MAVPFRRTSKMVKRQRRTHKKLSMPGISKCANCGEIKLSHRACKACGSYRGREVIEIEVAE